VRSKLFVPGSRPELFRKAFAGAADAISLDLEDSVTPERKTEARRAVAEWLDTLMADPAAKAGKAVIVRINAADTPYFDDDLRMACHPAVDTINLPKPASPREVADVAALLRQYEERRGDDAPLKLLLNIETPAALRQAADLAAADSRVAGLQLGLADLFETLGVDRSERSAIEQTLYAVRLATGEAGVYAYDSAFPNIKDAAGFTEEARLARRLGYLGKSCIHPSQIALANEVFQPTPEEIDFAKRVIAAADEARAAGQGACKVDGKMIDPPFELRARNTLAAAERYGLVSVA